MVTKYGKILNYYTNSFTSFFYKMFLLCHCLGIWCWLQMKSRLHANVLNKQTEEDIPSNLAHVEISQML